MDVFIVIALVGIALLLAELLLPTGGVLAGLGALALVAGGVVALTIDSDSALAGYAGPALITLGILSIVTSYFIGRKVLAAHLEQRVRTGQEELIGALAEARTSLDPEGQVWIEGALWHARLTGEGASLRPGDRVRVESVDGLTLVVLPEPEDHAALVLAQHAHGAAHHDQGEDHQDNENDQCDFHQPAPSSAGASDGASGLT
ncbi:MAG TPA: NfeD family protein, partial [Solirubrobacterales bacterium]